LHGGHQRLEDGQHPLGFESLDSAPISEGHTGEEPLQQPRRREYPDPFRPRRIVVEREGPDNRKKIRRE
jgi:hypothetical protein